MNPPSRILVVDDDPALRDLLSAYLTDTGFVVDLAGDGAGMRRAIEQARPDAIVLDLMLPGEDGLMLTRALRAQAGTAATIPVLILSARGEETRSGGGAGDGRRRLPGQAVQSARTARPAARAVAARQCRHPPSVPDQDAYRFGPYCLDLAARRLLKDAIDLPASRARNSICSRRSPSAPIGC
jgi:two-component system OmpR family response regulator